MANNKGRHPEWPGVTDEGDGTYSIELDFAQFGDSLDDELKEYADEWGVRAKIVVEHGPGGGNAIVKVIGSENALRLLLEDYFKDEE